ARHGCGGCRTRDGPCAPRPQLRAAVRPHRARIAAGSPARGLGRERSFTARFVPTHPRAHGRGADSERPRDIDLGATCFQSLLNFLNDPEPKLQRIRARSPLHVLSCTTSLVLLAHPSLLPGGGGGANDFPDSSTAQQMARGTPFVRSRSGVPSPSMSVSMERVTSRWSSAPFSIRHSRCDGPSTGF